jgi:DNA-binding LytR/AlgR family response regulator
MKKKILIIEDDVEQQRFLEHLVRDADSNTEVYLAADASTAYRLLLEKTIDVFMVDIILEPQKPGDVSGIQLIEKVRHIPKYLFTPVIFITSMEDPNKYAYTDLHCMGYIEKPYHPAQVTALLAKALHYRTSREKDSVITFRKDGVLYPVKVADILYMENHNHKMNIHLTNSSPLEIPYKTCKQILQEIDNDSIIQCSRNTLVNKDYILAVDLPNQCIVLKDNQGRLDIGITYKRKMALEFGDGC